MFREIRIDSWIQCSSSVSLYGQFIYLFKLLSLSTVKVHVSTKDNSEYKIMPVRYCS